MALRWFVDSSRARLTWSTAVVDGKATTDIYELIQRQDRSEVALLRFRWANNGDTVTAGRVAGAQAVASAAAIPTGTVFDAVVRSRGGSSVVDNQDGTAAWSPTGAFVDNGDGTATFSGS